MQVMMTLIYDPVWDYDSDLEISLIWVSNQTKWESKQAKWECKQAK
jgi:hypothetical protein